MLSKNKFVEEKLKSLVILQQNEETQGDFEWIKDYESINFWDFLSVNYLELDRLFTMLDVETGPHSGWEKFVEVLGLTLWEDRKWCYQYHNGAGPTKAALSKLLSKDDYDRNLSLSYVLEILKEMDRYDILLQIDWDLHLEKFKTIGKSALESKDEPKCLVFQLNRSLDCDNLVKSEPVVNAHNEMIIGKTKSSKMGKQKVPKSTNAICILMTYAPDAEEWATDIADLLRKQILRGKTIKILMIGDPNIKRALAMDCNNTLHKWFNQVRYVVPVLSPQYLRQVQNLDYSEENRDVALYNRLIYRFTLDQFASFGSRNLRCRPVCSNLYFSQVRDSAVVKGNGLFSVIWSCENDIKISEFAQVLMDPPFQD